MGLKDRISDDMKSAMRARDQQGLSAIRMLRAAIQRREVDEQTELDDREVLAVVQKLIKQGQESVEQFRRGNREDLAEREEEMIERLRGYLPEPLGEAELDALVEEAIRDAGASGIRDMGAVMGRLRDKVQGRADMGQVSTLVKARLSG